MDTGNEFADHRAVVAGLSPDDRAALTKKTDRHALIRFAAHLGAIGLLGWLILSGVPFWPLLMLPQGILVVFLFTALHEAIHETAFRTPWLNRAVAWIAGLLVLIPPAWFRYFHFAHHRHTNDPDNDPELMSPKPESWRQYVIYMSGVLFWFGTAKVIVANAAGRGVQTYVPDKGLSKIVVEARAFLAIYAALAAGSVTLQSTTLLWVWIVPALIGQPFLRGFLLAEHARCPQVANMLENTRTTFTTALVRLIAWNMPYHAEHHSYPVVPFHQLPRFHAFVASRLRITERGYGRFHGKYARELAEKRQEIR